MNPSYPGSSGDRHGPPSLSSASSAGLGGKGSGPQQPPQQQQHSYHPQPSLAQLTHGGHLHPLHGGPQQPQQQPQHSMMHPGGPVLPPPPPPGSLGGGSTSRSPHPLSGSILHPPRGNLGGPSNGPSVLGKPAGSQGPPPSSAAGMMGHSVRMQPPSMSPSMGSVQQAMASSSGGLKPPSQGYSVRPQSPPRRPTETQQQQQQQQQQQVPIQQQYGLDGRIIPNDQVEGDYYQQQQTMSGPPPRHRELRVEDALLYLDQVKQQFGDQPDIYNQFLDVMKDFKAQAIDTPGVILRVSTLFRGYPNLILGFNTFLPPGYRIRPDTSIEVIPSQMAGRGGVQQSMYAGVGAQQPSNANMGHRPPPVTIPPPPYSPPELHKPTPSSRQQLAPAGQMKAGGKPKKQQQQAPTPSGGNAAARSSTNPVEFDHAIHYVTTIKQRFADEPETYKEFLAILHTYQKEQRSIRQVLDQVSHLFRDHPDLLREFTFFLPDAVQEQAKERLNRAAEKAQQRKDQMAQRARKYGTSQGYQQSDRRDDRGADSPSSAAMKGGRLMAEDEDAYMKYGKKGSGRGYKDDDHRLSGKALERREKERERERNRAQFNHKRAKRRPYDGKERRAYLAISDVLLDKEEWNIFEKIKKILPSRDNWREFLKCLELYSQEVLDRNEMLSLIRNLFGRHTELVEEFDHLLSSHGVQKTPKEIWPFIPLAETDLSQCRRATPSYRGLPASYPIPPCSHRSALEKQVCNDSWVSVPTGSEDFSFKSMRKNQYEEALFKCEDERFEIDMVIEANASTISVLEPLAHEIEVLKKTKDSNGDDDKMWNYVVDKGTFRVTHLNAITRIYGDAGTEILDLLRKYPAGAIPVILKRLKQKDEEWRRAREDLNHQWKEVNEKNYHKSLDHSSFYFKQKDKKQTSMKMMMQEAKKKLEADEKRIEEAKTESNASPSTVSATAEVVSAKAPPQASDIADALRKEQSSVSKVTTELSQPVPSGKWKPHFAYKFASVQIHKEAFGLLSYAAEKNLSVADKEKISKVWQAFFFPFFHLEEEWLVRKPQRTTVSLEKAKTLPVGTEVSTEFGDGTVQQFNKEKGYFTINLTAAGCQAYLQPGALTIQEAADFPPGLPALDSKQDAAKVKADYKSLFYGNQHAFAFLRLYQMLQNRLERAFDLCEKAKRNRNRRTINPAARALAHAHHSLSASTKEKTGDYQAFVSKLYSLIDGSVDNSKYEDSCRSLMGSTSYFLFTMDKLVTLVLKQMQHLANDDTCQELIKAFTEVQGEPKPSTDPAGAEAKAIAYLNKTKSIFEGEGAFRIEFNPGVLRKTPLEARGGGSTPMGASEPFKIWAPSPRVKVPEFSKWLVEPELAIEYLGSMDDDGDDDDDDDDDESPSATPVDTPSATPMYGSPVHDTPVHESQDDDDDEPMEESKEDDNVKNEISTPASSGSVEQSDSASASSDDARAASAVKALESATLLKKRARDSSEEEGAVSEPSPSFSAAVEVSVAAKKAKTGAETSNNEMSAENAQLFARGSQEDDPMTGENEGRVASSSSAQTETQEVKLEKTQEQTQEREKRTETERQTGDTPKEQQAPSLDNVKSERPSDSIGAVLSAVATGDVKAHTSGVVSLSATSDDKRKD